VATTATRPWEGRVMTVLSEAEQEALVAELLARPIDEVLDEAAAAASWEEAWPWLASAALRGSDEVFEAACARMASEEPSDRAIGADVLGRLVSHAPGYADRALERLAAMLDGGEDDPEVLAGALGGLSWLQDTRALELLLRFVDHPDESVRFGAAVGIPGSLDQNEPDPDGVAALLELTADDDEDVRDVATVALASQLQVDTPEVRAALAERLSDSKFDTSCEALVGLARLGDHRAYPVLMAVLTAPREERLVSTLQVQAAGLLGHPRLHAHLVDLRSWWDVDPDLLEWAIKRCAPRGGDQRALPTPESDTLQRTVTG
jgi:HEAT repeat protein